MNPDHSNVNAGKGASRSFLLILTFLLIWFSEPTIAQQPVDTLFTKTFKEKLDLAIWLDQYDEVSWQAMDSLKRFGKENLLLLGDGGFCFQDSNQLWHLVYCDKSKNELSLLFHYFLDSSSILRVCNDDTYGSKMLSYFSALTLCNKALVNFQDSAEVHFNQYIRNLPDGNLEVLVLPAFQPSGQAIYGAEWVFRLNPEGSSILSTSNHISELKGIWIGQPRILWLNYRNDEYPTLGSIYFAWTFKDYFTRIHIACKNVVSTLSQNPNGAYHWEYENKEPINGDESK